MMRGRFGALIQGATGAELAQSRRGRTARMIAALGGAQAQSLTGPDRSTLVDTRPAQIFPTRPNDDELDPAAVGVNAFPHLPGRASPAGWDGESGAAQPEGTTQ